MPIISVVIPAYNSANTIAATLDSLVAQNLKDFDVILVNDASTDDTQAIIENYRNNLSLKILSVQENQGVAKSLNMGVANSDSEFIARLDSDDLARSDRLEKQLAFMQANVAVDVCGSDMEMFSDEDESRYLLAHPASNTEIKTAFVQRCAIAHPSVLARRSFFEDMGGYDPRFDFCEDYELWCRASLLGKQFANISECLTHYRRHAGQVSVQKSQIQLELDMAVKKKYLTGLLDGLPIGYLAEFLSITASFISKSAALSIMTTCMPQILQLGQRVPHAGEYARIVSSSIQRHLA
jgi:glycosyltransferase involved in cell wall biosynthesis